MENLSEPEAEKWLHNEFDKVNILGVQLQ